MLLTLEFGSPEILDDLLPVGRVVVPSEVGLQPATENLERSTLADTVGSDETEDLAGARHRQTVQFEGVGAIAVRHLRLEVRRKVDDGDTDSRQPCLVAWSAVLLRLRTHASKGHFLVQIEHPMHRDSEIKATRDSGETSMQSLPARTTGQARLHSWWHFCRDQSGPREAGSRTIGRRIPSACTIKSQHSNGLGRRIPPTHLVVVDDGDTVAIQNSD
jgi:hypothetical protein